MATPSDLVSHYSSHAFRTRICALAFAGAVLAAVIGWKRAEDETNLIGLVLIAVVGSLGELNRRYTHSYLAACRASQSEVSRKSDEAATAIRWELFSEINEWRWSTRSGSIFRLSPLKIWCKRFFLNWLTYIPGLLVGVLIIFRGKRSALGWAGIALATVFFLLWVIQSRDEFDPKKVERIVAKISPLDPGVQPSPGQRG